MRAPGRPGLLAVGGAAGAALAAWAAWTTPFTGPADAVSAIGIGALAVVVALRWRRPVLSGAGVPAEERAPWWPWLAVTLAIVAWELVSFSLGPRIDHPTVSSLYDSATRWRAVKGLFFFAWLALGAALVRS